MTLSTNSPDRPVALVVESDLCNTQLCAASQTASSTWEVRVTSATELPAAIEAEAPCCLICDLRHCQFENISRIEHGNNLVDELQVACPVICLTTSPKLSDVVHAIQSGVFDVLVTPVEPTTLWTTIERAIQAELAERERLQHRQTIYSCIETLTKREREVMSLVVEGFSLKQIASRLDVRFQTAAKHRARVLRKMGVANDVQLTLRMLPTQQPDACNLVCRISNQGDLVWG